MSGMEMLKGQFNRVAVREQLFAIFFPNQRSLPLKIFERFFSPGAARRSVTSVGISKTISSASRKLKRRPDP